MIDTITVIGGGWSAGTLAKPPVGIGHVIGVNDAFLRARCDIGVTMDRLWMENRWLDVKARIGAAPRSFWARQAALKNVTERPAWLVPFGCDHFATAPSFEAGMLNGTSSGMCAINLALAGAIDGGLRRIVLIGFDMNRSPDGRAYWFGSGYPWAKDGGATTGGKYKAWSSGFGQLAAEAKRRRIEIINTSLTSDIPNFVKAPLESLR